MDCVFCKIVAGVIPSPRVFEDEDSIVIRDLHPQARHHFLVIPKRHADSLAAIFEADAAGQATVGKLFSVANRVAKDAGLLPGGFRSVINTGPDGGQTVFHLHLHVLGGEKLPDRVI